MENKKIVGVKFENKLEPKTFGGREYSYYVPTDLDIALHDIVEVPTRYGISIAMITKTGIPEEEIQSIKEFMKDIIKKLDKEEFLKNGIESK